MRIALVTDTYLPQINGVTTVVRRIADTARAAGHAVAIVAPRYPHGSGGDGGGGRTELRVPSLPFPPYPSIRLSFPFRPSRRALPRSLRARPGPCRHRGSAGRRSAAATPLDRGLPLRDVVPHRFPAVRARLRARRSWRRSCGGGCVHFHRPARMIQTPGVAVRDELVRRGLRNTVVWGRGVDTRHFRPDRRHAGWRRWMAGADDTVIVLHVGRLAPEKNLRVLVDAWNRAHRCLGPRATFVIAGEGPEAPLRRDPRPVRPAARVSRSRHPRRPVRLGRPVRAAVPHRDVRPRRPRGDGRGLPVIAADAGGLAESVRHEENGLLVRPDDARGFSHAIVALALDAARRRALAAGARQHRREPRSPERGPGAAAPVRRPGPFAKHPAVQSAPSHGAESGAGPSSQPFHSHRKECCIDADPVVAHRLSRPRTAVRRLAGPPAGAIETRGPRRGHRARRSPPDESRAA